MVTEGGWQHYWAPDIGANIQTDLLAEVLVRKEKPRRLNRVIRAAFACDLPCNSDPRWVALLRRPVGYSTVDELAGFRGGVVGENQGG